MSSVLLAGTIAIIIFAWMDARNAQKRQSRR